MVYDKQLRLSTAAKLLVPSIQIAVDVSVPITLAVRAETTRRFQLWDPSGPALRAAICRSIAVASS